MNRPSRPVYLDPELQMDRSTYPVRKITLAEEGHESSSEFTPAERVAMVWTLTKQAWTFKDGHWDEPRLRRDVVCTVRGGR